LEPDEVNTLFLTNSHSPIYCIYLEIYFLFIQESVGPDGMEGYENVTALAEFLLATDLFIFNKWRSSAGD
jgi:hypothetical protein